MADAHSADARSLIEASSLGSAGAKRLRARTPQRIRDELALVDRERLWQGIEERGGISAPANGAPLDASQYGYRQRSSSVSQAAHWNRILAGHPVYDPIVCGFEVGAAPVKVNGYFLLIWIPAERGKGTVSLGEGGLETSAPSAGPARRVDKDS